MTKIKDLIKELEIIAPPSLQEGYDNAGLLVGDKNKDVTGVVYCLDSTEDVIQEAIDKNCNLVIAHHPIVFSGLKRFTGSNYVQRTIIKAIKNDVAIYAIHTNLDNVLYQGVNEKICKTLGLEKLKILAPKSNILSVEICCTNAAAELTKDLNNSISNSELSGKETNFTFIEGEQQALIKGQFPAVLKGKVLSLCNTYNSSISNGPIFANVHGKSSKIGSGMIGTLEKDLPTEDFLQVLKDKMNLKVLKHTNICTDNIKKIAVCGGAGGFLLNTAIAQQADIFITSDYKYHEFFDADNKIIIADIGHFESEQFTIRLLCDIISEKFSSFANYCTSVKTNPVNYF
jgi:dinuclear metal center YbgI/SA1388 family protein